MKPSPSAVLFCIAGNIIDALGADASIFRLILGATTRSRASLFSYYRATGARNAGRISVKAHCCDELVPVDDHFDGRDRAVGDEADDQQEEEPAHGQRE